MRNYKFYLQDILESIQKIETYTANMSCVEFESNTLVVDAVLRNVISHEYFGVDLGIIWETLHTDLQKFKRDIIRVIEAS